MDWADRHYFKKSFAICKIKESGTAAINDRSLGYWAVHRSIPHLAEYIFFFAGVFKFEPASVMQPELFSQIRDMHSDCV